MATNPGQTVCGRRLAAELLRLRKATGMSQEDVSARLKGDLAANSLSQIEKGKRGTTAPVLRMLFDVYEVPEDEQEALRELARQAREPGWWQQYRADALPDWARVFIALESAASEIRSWELAFVSGPLQTEDYCRAVLTASPAAGNPETIEQKVRLRMERQQRRESGDAPDLWVILSEMVVRCVVGGPAVMAAQLRHIAEMAARPGITVQLLEFRTGAHQGMDGSFTILRSEDGDVLYFEHQTSSVYDEDASSIARHRRTFDFLGAQALDPGDSIAYITRVADELDAKPA